MPDLVHWLIELDEGATLADMVGRLKSNSARAVNAVLGRPGQSVWAPAYRDNALRRDESLRAVAAYIVANPVRAGLVATPLSWPFWDARWLGTDEGWMP